jgi:hypothetical protein
MNFQGQLDTPQVPSQAAFAWLFAHEFRLHSGLLGNTKIQSPESSASEADVAVKVADAEQGSGLKESANMDWLVRNAEEFGRYKGEWLLINGQNLIVHDRDFASIQAAIRENQIASPFVYYVPTDQESNSVTI